MKMDISTEELLDELYNTIVPDIPENAITANNLVEHSKRKGNEISRSTAVRHLKKRIDEQGWQECIYKGERYYWPPE